MVPLMVYETIHTEQWYVCASDAIQAFLDALYGVHMIRLLASFVTHKLKKNKCAERRFRQTLGCACRVSNNKRHKRCG